MKKTLLSVLTIGTLLTSMTAFAEDREEVKIPKGPMTINVSVDSEKDSEKNEKNYEKYLHNSLSKMKARGAHLIDERIASLTKSIKMINKENLTDEQKAFIKAQVNTNILGLTTLKASIASSTDATSTKALVGSIYTKFRIYGIVIPQIRLEKSIYNLQNHVTNLSETFLKVQAKINEYKAKGNDVTVWQKNLDDSKILVTSDVSKLNALLLQAQALKPTDYGTSSKTMIDSINVGIKAVSKDFATISSTLRKPNLTMHATTTASVNATTTSH